MSRSQSQLQWTVTDTRDEACRVSIDTRPRPESLLAYSIRLICFLYTTSSPGVEAHLSLQLFL